MKAFISFIRSILVYGMFDRSIRLLTNGRTQDALFYKIPPIPKMYMKRNSLRKISKGNGSVSLDISDLVDWFQFWGFKDESLEFLLSKITPGMTVLDVGANHCLLAIDMAMRCTSTGMVYAFEPDKNNFQKSQANIDTARMTNIEVMNVACGSNEETLLLETRDDTNSGMHSLTRDTTVQGDASRIITLDTFVFERNIQPDLLKIDTEGFELEVILGARRMLLHYKPFIFVEIDKDNLERQGSKREDLFAFLRNLGYSFYDVPRKRYFSESEKDFLAHFDVFCSCVDIPV